MTRPTVDELQKLLESDEQPALRILPNGKVLELVPDGREVPTDRKPVTFGVVLGSKY